MLHIIKPGALTTIQDLGRTGFAHLGVSPAGAADSVSFRIANLLVGNDMNAPALEATLLCPTIEFEVAATIAISGSRNPSVPMNEALEVAAGQRLAIGPLLDGARAYIAIRGGIAIPEVMLSCSTFIPATMGGYKGRALKAGDTLEIDKRVRGSCRKLSANSLDRFCPPSRGPLRVTSSLQQDWFDEETIKRFHHQVFKVSDDSNRSGLRLAGDPIFPQKRQELLTEGIALGAVQVTPEGQPIILFVDQQTTGGYPKIANVIAADLARVGQLRPRDEVTFRAVSVPEAIELLRQQEKLLAEAFAI